MRAARLTTPTLRAIWQIIVRDTTVNPTARTRMQKALEAADDTASIATARDKATTTLTALTDQLVRVRAVVRDVVPTLDEAITDEQLLALVERLLAEARRTRQVERERLTELGRFEDGHTTHTLVMRALEDLHDRGDAEDPDPSAGDSGAEPTQTDGRATAADSGAGTARGKRGKDKPPADPK
jgi:hypothetical protein